MSNIVKTVEMGHVVILNRVIRVDLWESSI